MQDKMNCLKNMILMMRCDGRISSREKQFLARSAKALGVESDIVNELFKEVKVSNKDLYEISNRSRAIDTLKSLVVMANVDKSIHECEKVCLMRFAKSLALSNQQWKQMLKQVDLKTLFNSFQTAPSDIGNTQSDLCFTVIKDDFKKIDHFVDIAAESPIKTKIVSFDKYISALRCDSDFVYFHASEDKNRSVHKCKKLLQRSPDKTTAILTRYEGHKVKYLLEEGKKNALQNRYTRKT